MHVNKRIYRCTLYALYRCDMFFHKHLSFFDVLIHRSPTRSSRFELSSPSGGEGAGGRREEGQRGERGGGQGETSITSSRTSAPSTPVYPRSNDQDDFPRPLAVSYPHFGDNLYASL